MLHRLPRGNDFNDGICNYYDTITILALVLLKFAII